MRLWYDADQVDARSADREALWARIGAVDSWNRAGNAGVAHPTAANVKAGNVDDIAHIFGTRGDLAHLALFLWASGASALLVWTLKELAASNRRFNDFVNEIARLNRFFDRD